ncbi:hypothetical protein FPQ18DRAFT_395621 [Pyronema domesticum]|nr:hypothetical protein FPQ18DRAFT_395621 [Pyronema domesticum]
MADFKRYESSRRASRILRRNFDVSEKLLQIKEEGLHQILEESMSQRKKLHEYHETLRRQRNELMRIFLEEAENVVEMARSAIGFAENDLASEIVFERMVQRMRAYDQRYRDEEDEKMNELVLKEAAIRTEILDCQVKRAKGLKPPTMRMEHRRVKKDDRKDERSERSEQYRIEDEQWVTSSAMAPSHTLFGSPLERRVAIPRDIALRWVEISNDGDSTDEDESWSMQWTWLIRPTVGLWMSMNRDEGVSCVRFFTALGVFNTE